MYIEGGRGLDSLSGLFSYNTSLRYHGNNCHVKSKPFYHCHFKGDVKLFFYLLLK